MGNYAWKSGDREGKSSRKPNYSVKWEWSHPEIMGYRQYTDLTHATNAERAINKVRKSIEEEYAISRRDMVIIHVVPIDGIYYDEGRTTHDG